MANDMTVAQLEKLLDQKKAILDGLQKKREKLQQELSAVETKISSVGGGSEAAPGKRTRRLVRRSRPQNTKTLLQVVLEVLGQNKKGLLLNDLSQKVLDTGYKTGSSKFANTVYQCLYNNTDTIVCDPISRLYRLK